jgi:hypothetical protein
LTVQAYIQPNGLAVAQQAVRKPQGISLLVHGVAKAGKSSIGDTGPVPRLILDVETASFWTPSRKAYWDFKRQTCPAADGSWDTCIVTIHDYTDLYGLLEFLNKGQHPFNSASMDSVTEIQQRVVWSLAGTGKMKQDDWGALLRHVNGIIRGYRDLLTHPTRPLWSVVYIAGTHFDQRQGRFRPLVQGSSQDYLPYVPDLLGWIEAAPDGTRHLWTGPSQLHETGERLWGRLPYDMQLGYPGKVPGWTVESMVSHVLATQ